MARPEGFAPQPALYDPPTSLERTNRAGVGILRKRPRPCRPPKTKDAHGTTAIDADATPPHNPRPAGKACA